MMELRLNRDLTTYLQKAGKTIQRKGGKWCLCSIIATCPPESIE